MALRALLALAVAATPLGAQDVESVRDYMALYQEEGTGDEDRAELAQLLLEEAEALFPLARDTQDRAVDGAFVDAAFLALSHELMPSEIPALEFCRVGVEEARAQGKLLALYVFARSGARFAGDAGDVPRAKEFLLDAYPFDGVAPFFRATALAALAALYRTESRWGEGLRVLAEAEEVLLGVEEAEATYPQICVLGERAENLIAQGALHAAALTLGRLNDWAARTEDPELLGKADRHRVQLALASGQFLSVILEVRALREKPLFERLAGPDRAALLVMEGIALAAYARGTAAEPEALEEARATLDRVRTEFGVEELVALQMDLHLVDLALRQGDLERAAAEVARGRKRIERAGERAQALQYGTNHAALALRVARLTGAEPEELRRRRDDFLASFETFLANWSEGSFHADVAFLHENPRRTIVVERITAELGAGTRAERERAFEVLLDVQARGSAWSETGREAPRLADVRAALKEGHGLLVYLPAPEGGHVFAVDQKDVVHATLGPQHDLARACRELDVELARAATDDRDEGIEERLRAAADTCTRLLIAPVSERLERWSGVTIVGGEFLQDIPFEFLRDDTGTPLGEAKAVDAWPSVPRGLLLRERTPAESPTSRLVLLVAAKPAGAAATEKLAPLPVTAADLDRLTADRAAPEARRVLALTPARLAAEQLAGVPLVHVVAHAIYADEGALPGMALVLESEGAEDGDGNGHGLFTRADVAALKLSGLVLLSACEAARGLAFWGNDGLASLGGACLDAGARAVVQARSRITYRETVDVMSRLTELLLEENLAPAEALRRVRTEQVGEERSEVDRARLAGYRVLGFGQEPAWR